MNLNTMEHSMRRYLRYICFICFVLFTPKWMFAQTFVHPGILHKESDFDRMRQKVQAGLQPWQAGWAKLIANSHAQLNYTPNPVTTIVRGNGWPENYWTFMNDVSAAYQCALRWKISGDNAYANKAVQIMNDWASTCTGVDGSPDAALVVGLQGFQLANAAEIMRSYSGWRASDFSNFKNFMIKVFYVNASKFLFARNGTCPTTYYASWGLCNASAVVAIGILCDDMQIYNEGMYYFKYGPYTEAINNAVYYLHTPTLGQWQESNRDQSHTLLGVGLAADLCEMAWNQGEDLYSFASRRLLAGFEYVAKYNLGNDVPDIPYNNCENSNETSLGTLGRGGIRPIWERIYNHYVNRAGLQVPYSQQFASMSRPEGGGGDYGSSSGGFDNIGFGTLTNSLDPLPPGCVPSVLSPFVQIDGGTQTQSSNLTVSAGATVKLSPQASDSGTWSWSNGQGTRELVLTNLQKSVIYRATFTNSCGMQSTQSFCIGVLGDCLPTPIIPYAMVNADSWQQTDRLTVDSGASITFGPQPVNQGKWQWSTGDTVRQFTIGNWKVSANIVAHYTSPCGVMVVDTFRITVRNPRLDLMTVLNAAIRLRDTTQTSTTVVPGKYPVAAKAILNDSIVYVQTHYDSLRSTKPEINGYIALLNRSIVRYKQSVYYETNKLQDGTYYIMNIGKDSLLTVSNNNATQFTTKAADKNSQLFNITKDGNGHYKITLLAPPPPGYQNYINENGQIGTNSYDPAWNTFNIFFDGQHYAIERTQNSGNGFWSINGKFIGFQSGSNNSPLPAAFPFTLQPDIYVALDMALAQAIKLRDTTQITTGTELGKFPQSMNSRLADSIVYVQSQYSTISTISQSTALVNKLNNMMALYRKSMFYNTNQLADGIYFIKNGDQESYWTSASGNTPDFEQRNNNDINSQRWKITKQSNGRYAINSLKMPPTGYKNYINENAQFGSNDYYENWNTMMFYFDGVHYAIERAEQAGNGYWYISNNTISNTGNLSDVFPYTYPFKLMLAPDTQRISFTPIGSLQVNDHPVALSAQATSGLPVTFASSDTTIAKVVADSLRILKAGTCIVTANQSGNGFFAAAPPTSQNITIAKLNQTFTQITAAYNKTVGDADFTLSASASSQMPVTYRSLDSTVVSVSGNVVHILSTGTARIVVSQVGNDTFSKVDSLVKVFIKPLNLILQYKDGDNNLSNNVIKPNFKLVNQDSSVVALNELAVRYWLTPENYTGINSTIDYAQIGTQNVTGSYFSLQSPRKNALGYIEYHFTTSAGNLQPGTDTGPIQASIANTDWSNLDESNDYSFNSSSVFTLNPKITLYRNGVLIRGVEPPADTVSLKVNAWYQNQNQTANTNTIRQLIRISNDGNIPVNYSDLEVRYWFTKDGTENLNYYLNYSKLPYSQIAAHFNDVAPPIQNADTYLSLTFNSGVLYPLTGSGDIQSGIAKTDWSNFNELNDYSYMPNDVVKGNNHITLYYKGQLIYGTEPTTSDLMSLRNASSAVATPQHKVSNEGVVVHQALSPNGDGVNDVLIIDGLTAYPDNRLTIINSNGVKVFEAKGYDNATKVFDGHSSINGTMQKPGTYYFSLDYLSGKENVHKTGFIILKY